MSDVADLYTALSRLRMWADDAMDNSKPNSDRYDNARSDRDWAERKLREIATRPRP